jgi:hypothetical protein
MVYKSAIRLQSRQPGGQARRRRRPADDGGAKSGLRRKRQRNWLTKSMVLWTPEMRKCGICARAEWRREYTVKSALAVTLTFALLSGTARAQTHATHGSVWVLDSIPASRVASNVEQWTLGFLSGVADATHGRLDPLHKTDDQAVWNWIDNYCKAHPPDLIANAAGKFAVAHPR